MKTTITAALLGLVLAAALPSVANAGSVEVDVHRHPHRHIIVLPDEDVLIPRLVANVIIIDGEACTVKTIRAWVDGNYVMRRVVRCDD